MGKNSLLRFEPEAQKALRLAQDEAQRRQHPQVAIEHLLLGLVNDPTTTAGRILERLGVDRVRVETVLQSRSFALQDAASPRLDLSPGTKKLMELAARETQQRGHQSITTGHLLMAVVRLEETGTIRLLAELNVPLDDMRQRLDRALSDIAEVSLEERIKRRLLETGKPVGSLTIDELRMRFDEALKAESLALGPLAQRHLFAEVIAALLD